MIETKDHRESIAAWMEERKQVQEALKPFAELVRSTNGRIPVERLAFADWDRLCKAYRKLEFKKEPTK